MKLLALLPLAALAADVIVASAVPARHHRIARALNRKRRCLARPHDANTNASASVTSLQVTYPTETQPPAQEKSPSTDNSTPANYQQPAADYKKPDTNNPPAQPQSGTINVESQCGDIGATCEWFECFRIVPSNLSSSSTADSTTTSGPNGSIYWLNCGIQDGGWRPPFFTTSTVISKDLGAVLSESGNPYGPCSAFLDAFYQASSAHDIPPILLAAIAMQESTCNPDIIGANGEQGLMQITPDKCQGGYASADCRNPYYNIDAGAKYLRKTLNDVGGNLPQALGTYNGWTKGMTYEQATRARNEGRCFAQNNLDYLHQTFNGWMQGIDPHNRNMGVFFNLKDC